MALELNFNIVEGDFTLAGMASSKIKKTLKQLNVDPKTIKRTVVAIYEAEVNVVAHSHGGELNAYIENDQVEVEVKDYGPGIPDIDQAMQEGFSTASKAVRDMGFGAGMGLPNIKRNTDDLQIDSVVGEGTTLRFKNRF